MNDVYSSICTPDSMPCTAFQEYCIGFRYSPELTERLNNPHQNGK